MERVLDNIEERDTVIEKILRNITIELTLEYAFHIQGEQNFEVIDDTGMRISRLHYPHRGEMVILNGEVRFLPRVSLGGRYATSLFERTTCTDTDWLILTDIVWNESHSSCKEGVSLYDINLYYRLIDLDKESIEEESIYSDGLGIKDIFIPTVDKLSLDVFVGYQQQKGRYGTSELVDTVEGWTPVNIPYNGQDSFYKICYRGPRVGLRLEGSSGKVTSRLSFAYAFLNTKAFGWWNLRQYEFEQHGRSGFGVNIETELAYNFTPNITAGLGFHFFICRQKRLRESGSYPG